MNMAFTDDVRGATITNKFAINRQRISTNE